MQITAIIAEYNPFHNGHAYQIQMAREKTNADYLIVIMSGNFVQRGAPAIVDKYVRAQMALLENADLVIELPTLWSTASAEYFAACSIHALQHLHCVQTLCYGCETISETLFSKLSHILATEPNEYRNTLMSCQKSGLSFPQARIIALTSCLSKAEQETTRTILSKPNNILALEYEKALRTTGSNIQSLPILRLGQDYHVASFEADSTFSSATAIRKHILQNQSIQQLNTSLPASVYKLLSEQSAYLSENDFSQMLHYALLQYQTNGYKRFADCTPALSNKIKNNLQHYSGFSEFCSLLKSKDLTHTRIQRCLLHILLNIHQTDYDFWKIHGYMPYIRIIGFRKSAAPLLTELKKHCDLPLIIRATDSRKHLHHDLDIAFWEQQLFADQIYQAAQIAQTKQAFLNEYQRKLLII